MPNPISNVYNKLPKEDQDLLEKWGIKPYGGIIECHFDFMIKVARKLEQLSSQKESNP